MSSILGVLQAVIVGAGLNAGPQWLFADAIARGELVHILSRWQSPTGTLQALVLAGCTDVGSSPTSSRKMVRRRRSGTHPARRPPRR